MEKIPTAEKMFKANPILSEGVERQACIAFMKVFAKLHVEAALKEASKKLNYNRDFCNVQKDILNAYPLENIK